MDGIIFDIRRFALHDGPGIRTTVFFKGCPLHCRWCHNPESLEKAPECFRKVFRLNDHEFTEDEMIGYKITAHDLFAELQKEHIFMDESKGGITFSGGEPLYQPEFLLEMLRLCRNAGLHTAVDTSFFTSWQVIGQVAEFTNLFLIDLKLMDNPEHEKQTGVPNEPILKNIRKLAAETQRAFRIRIPMIPNITATRQNVEQSISFLKRLERPAEAIDLLPFHNSAKHKYKRMLLDNHFEYVPSMTKDELAGFKSQFEYAGFTVNTGG